MHVRVLLLFILCVCVCVVNQPITERGEIWGVNIRHSGLEICDIREWHCMVPGLHLRHLQTNAENNGLTIKE